MTGRSRGSKLSIWRRAVAMARRNPLATIASAVAIFAGIPGATLGLNYITAVADSWVPAFRPDVIVDLHGKKVPVIVLALEHSTTLDYLILKDQRQALKYAQADMEKAPNATTQNEINRLKRSIEQRQERLDKATGGK